MKMLSDGRKGRLTARAQPADEEWVVQYGEVRLLTATDADAAALGMTQEALAEKWAADLNAALAKLQGSTGDADNPK